MQKIFSALAVIFSTLLLTTTLWASDGISFQDTKLITMGKKGVIYGTFIGGNTTKKIQSMAVNGVTKIEVHNMKMNNGMMKMFQMKNFTIKAGEKTYLKKGGIHIMLMGIQKKLNKAIMTITFTDGTSKTFTIGK